MKRSALTVLRGSRAGAAKLVNLAKAQFAASMIKAADAMIATIWETMNRWGFALGAAAR